MKSKYLNFLLPDVMVCQEFGGGVCIYLRNSVIFSTCVNYSNSGCDIDNQDKPYILNCNPYV